MSQSLQRILYVEDDPDIQEVACMSFSLDDDLVIEPCDSGSEALAKATSFGPDLVLLDVMMPDMDGPTTFAELRQIPDMANVPVIFMTAKVQRDEVDRYLALGAIGVIPKPFDPMTLADQVKTLWHQHNDK